jgi:hypothetical protein
MAIEVMMTVLVGEWGCSGEVLAMVLVANTLAATQTPIPWGKSSSSISCVPPLHTWGSLSI